MMIRLIPKTQKGERQIQEELSRYTKNAVTIQMHDLEEYSKNGKTPLTQRIKKFGGAQLWTYGGGVGTLHADKVESMGQPRA